MNITTQCRLIRSLLFLCACLQLLYFVLTWGNITPHLGSLVMHFTTRGITSDEMQKMNPLQWVAGLLLALPSVLAMLYSLWKLDRLLVTLGSAQTKKTLFSTKSIGQLKSFAGGLALSTLLGIMEEPARGLLFLLLPGEHANKVGCSVDTEEIILLLACTVFYLVTGMMHEGRKLAEENEGFI